MNINEPTLENVTVGEWNRSEQDWIKHEGRFEVITVYGARHIGVAVSAKPVDRKRNELSLYAPRIVSDLVFMADDGKFPIYLSRQQVEKWRTTTEAPKVIQTIAQYNLVENEFGGFLSSMFLNFLSLRWGERSRDEECRKRMPHGFSISDTIHVIDENGKHVWQTHIGFSFRTISLFDFGAESVDIHFDKVTKSYNYKQIHEAVEDIYQFIIRE